MTLNFQNKIVFPAPESSYTTETAYGQVIYLPRDILTRPKKKDDKNNDERKEIPAGQVNFAINDVSTDSKISKIENGSKDVPENDDSIVKEKAKLIQDESNIETISKESQEQAQLDDNPSLLSSSAQSTSSTDSKSKEQSKAKDTEYIPCLYLPYDDGARKLIIYFHGNAEDIGLAYDLLYQFGNELKMHVLAVDYPGYGLYKTSPPSENQIKEDSEILFDYLSLHVGIKESDIILFGRSMGSGPATYLASKKNAFSLLLMSPYTSIKDVSRSLFGKLSFLVTPLVYERFRNIDTIKEAKCPVFFLHGLKDKLIPHQHSLDLNNNCPSASFLQLPQNMDHNEFDFIDDLLRPFQEFIKKIEDGQKHNRAIFTVNHNEEDKNQQQDDQIAKQKQRQKSREHAEDEDYDTHISEIDGSYTDYIKGSGVFTAFFDKQLYEPPASVVENEKRLIQIASSKKK